MASKAPRARGYQPLTKPITRRRRDRRQRQPVPTLAALLTVIPSLSRPELGRLVQRMIDHMDQMDGDPDLEDATDMEDDFSLTRYAQAYGSTAPGCSISDAGGQCDEDGINTAFPSSDGPGCLISDPDYGGEELGELDDGDIGFFADPDAYRDQTNRIRRDRCFPIRTQWRERGEIRSRVRYHRLKHWPKVPTKRQLLKRKRGAPRRPRP